MDAFDLGRFIEAQAAVIETVRRELAAGAKRTHWMWFVFPQLRSLGHSAVARHFGLSGLAEAKAYLAHPVLGPRLVDCTRLVNQVEGRDARHIFGSPDDMKFRSSMTLFGMIEPEPFATALSKYYAGQPDLRTLEILNAA